MSYSSGFISNTLPAIHDVTLSYANTEYSVAVAVAEKLSFKILTGGAIRYSYSVGKVATSILPYYTLASGVEESENFYPRTFTGILYLSSSTPGTVVIVKQWN